MSSTFQHGWVTLHHSPFGLTVATCFFLVQFFPLDPFSIETQVKLFRLKNLIIIFDSMHFLIFFWRQKLTTKKFKLWLPYILLPKGSFINDVTVIRVIRGKGYGSTKALVIKSKTMGGGRSNIVQNCVISFMEDP